MPQDMNSLVLLSIKLPMAEAIAKLVENVGQKVERGDKLDSTETIILTAAVGGIMQS